MAIPEALATVLASSWQSEGSPASRPVFPLREGKHAGKRRRKMSHARELRKALWEAVVRRGTTKAECELQTDTAQTRRVDCHSFRACVRDRAGWRQPA